VVRTLAAALIILYCVRRGLILLLINFMSVEVIPCGTLKEALGAALDIEDVDEFIAAFKRNKRKRRGSVSATGDGAVGVIDGRMSEWSPWGTDEEEGEELDATEGWGRRGGSIGEDTEDDGDTWPL